MLCAAIGCRSHNSCKKAEGEGGQIFCSRHWYLVPKSLRDEIWQSYRQRKTRPGYRRRHLELIQRAQQAIREAEAQM